jgi:hypothetical protein
MPGIRRVASLVAWAWLGLVVLVVAAGLALHLPPVRAAVLDWAVARAADTAGVRLEAARLDYNLLTLTAGVTDLTVASVTSPGVPFF